MKKLLLVFLMIALVSSVSVFTLSCSSNETDDPENTVDVESDNGESIPEDETEKDSNNPFPFETEEGYTTYFDPNLGALDM